MEILKVDDFERIDAVDCFYKEINNIYSKSTDQKVNFLKYLKKQLEFLDTGKEIPNRFELVKGCKYPIRSIRKRMEKNTRVLFFYYNNGSIILLHAFDENDDSAYRKAIKVAENRISDLGLKG